MTIRFDEKSRARRISSNPPTYETTWVAVGETDSAVVKAYASSTTPAIVAVAEGLLFRDDIVTQEIGHAAYDVIVRYVTQDQQSSLPTGSLKFAFSTTGGTFHITHSKSTVSSYKVGGGAAPDYEQAINAKKEESGTGFDIEGADIIIPALKISYTFSHPRGFLNESHARTLASITGCVNSDPWRGFAAGEVLFLGADGSDGTNADAECTYNVACESNLEGLVYGSITGVAKQGHDLLWVESNKGVSGGKPVVKVLAVRVERVYRRINLAAVLGF